MEDNFDFDKVGKRMPYKVPEDFFDTITESTLAEAERRNTLKKEATWFNWPAISVAASLVLLLAFGYVFYMNRTEQKNQVAVLDKPAEKVTPSEIVAKAEPNDASVPTVVPQITEKAKNQVTAETTNTAIVTKQKPELLAKADKPESLDEVLANMSDDELMLLAAVAETDLNVYEQTFE
jgi:ABC-type Na+ efflux pump permease subunit